MSEGKINGNLRISDGTNDYKTLKELVRYVPTILYNNSTGSRDITIQNLYRYSFIDVELRTIYYDRKIIKRIYLDEYQFKSNNVLSYYPYDNRIQLISADIVYNGTDNLRIDSEYFINFGVVNKTSMDSTGSLSYLRITKVIGYDDISLAISDDETSHNDDINNIINHLEGVLQKEVCLYDRKGVEANNYNKSNGILGSESIVLDMTNYKRIKVYGSANARSYQFTLDIDLTDNMNTYNSSNKYHGITCFWDPTYDSGVFFAVDCSVSSDKHTFYFDNCKFVRYNNNHDMETRNGNASYYISKIFGIK